jgi:hypothetical protein
MTRNRADLHVSSRPRPQVRAAVTAVLLLLGLFVPATPTALAAQADVGYRDFSYAGGPTAPTADKPQSKLWFNAGSWWGSLWSPVNKAFTVHRLDGPTQVWSDTGVVIDQRVNAKVDVLWEGGYLYTVATGPSSTSTADSARVSKYSFANGRYVLETGYPVTIVSGGSESIVMDRDTTGVLWVTYTRGGKVYVTHSVADHASWVTPYVLPVPGAGDVSADDISALVSFGGKIGVLWGNQNSSSPSGNSYWFAVHKDGTDDSAASWTRELAYGGDTSTENADDHINIKSLQTDSEGRVVASVKTSLNNSSDPLIVVLVRHPDGSWDRDNVYGRAGENHTRAIVLLDDTNDTVHVFAAAPCCSGGVVYHKKASFAALANGNPFANGLGAAFIRSSLDTTINNPTSTKQTLDSTTGLVVLASDDTSRYYLHNRLDLADPDTLIPDTFIDSGPSGTVGSTSAKFSFSSDNTAARFECRLDGAAFSSCTSPHSYTDLAVGTHTFEVRAVTTAGPDPSPASRTWTVDENLPATFRPSADAPVKGGSPNTNYGTATSLLADTSPQEESYLRFDITGIGTRKVTSAKLRLYVTNGSSNGPGVYRTATDWTEAGLTWNTRPTRATTAIANPTSVSAKAWLEYDVSSVVQADGVFGFGVIPDSSDGMDAHSREAANRPELVVSFATDVTAPETTITSAPSGTVETSTADISFKADEPSTFQCRLDGAPFTACSSPVQLTGISNGDHVFEVKATDAAGNEDGTPATASWTVAGVDSTAPETTITSAPSGTTESRDAVLEFLSDEPATFECRLDGSTFTDCESPVHYMGLTDGEHVFEVRAVDTAGNLDQSPATATWTVRSGTLVDDGFESGTFNGWTVRTGGDGSATVQGELVKDGAWAARLSETSTTGSVSAIRRTFDTSLSDLSVSQDVFVAKEGVSGANVPLLRLFDGSGARVLSLYRQNLAKDKVYVSYDGSAFLTKGLLPLGTWARVQVHVALVAPGTSKVEISLNGQAVWSSTTATVATGISTVQLGNETAKQTFELYADNVLMTQSLE